MPESAALIFLLGLISLCLCLLTGIIFITARELRHTLRKVNGVLPTAEQALREAHRSLRQTRHLITTANAVADRLSAMSHRAYDAAEGTMEWLRQWTGRAQHLFMEHKGNGAGAEPRSHRRSRGVE